VLPGGDQHVVEPREHDLLDEMPETALGSVYTWNSPYFMIDDGVLPPASPFRPLSPKR
jgi:hypothetical protein